MARICNTEDDGKKWISTINSTEDDGRLTIHKEKSDGTFTGKHDRSAKDLFGRCFEESGGAPHRIWFVVPSNDHLYFGDFNEDEKMFVGHRILLSDLFSNLMGDQARPKASPEPPPGDDWTAEKPGTELP